MRQGDVFDKNNSHAIAEIEEQTCDEFVTINAVGSKMLTALVVQEKFNCLCHGLPSLLLGLYRSTVSRLESRLQLPSLRFRVCPTAGLCRLAIQFATVKPAEMLAAIA